MPPKDGEVIILATRGSNRSIEGGEGIVEGRQINLGTFGVPGSTDGTTTASDERSNVLVVGAVGTKVVGNNLLLDIFSHLVDVDVNDFLAIVSEKA